MTIMRRPAFPQRRPQPNPEPAGLPAIQQEPQMARTPRTKAATAPQADPGKGAKAAPETAAEVNSLDPDSDEAALFAYFARKITEAEAKAAVKKAEYDDLRGDVTALFNSAKGELRIPRKRMEEILAKMKLTDDEYIEEETKRAREHRLAGMPQLDLFARGDTADEAARAYNSGHRAGKAGLDPTPPKAIFPALHQDWMRGWSEGQKETQNAFLRGQELVAERAKKGKLVDDPDLAKQIDVDDLAKPSADEEAFVEGKAPDLEPGTYPPIPPPEPNPNARAPGEPIPVG